MNYPKIKEKQNYLNIALLMTVVVFFIFVICIMVRFSSTYSGSQVIRSKTANVFEGSIVSADGVVLSESNYGKAEIDRSKTNTDYYIKLHQGSLTYPEIYSSLLGYNSTRHGRSGLRLLYQKYLYDGKHEKPGKTLELTINHQLQSKAYSLMRAYPGSGSAVVMNNKTGAVQCIVSNKRGVEYNANEIDSRYDEYNSIHEFWFREWAIPRVPGSTFKIVSGLGIIDSGKDKEEYYDGTGKIQVNNITLQNFNSNAYGTLTLKNALAFSANVYFIKMYMDSVDYGALENRANEFMIGESIKTDFATLSSAWNVNSADKASVAQTVFGQGETKITTVQGAMILSSVVNGGNLLKPYVVASSTEKGGIGSFFKNLFKKNNDKRTVLGKLSSKSSLKKMKEYLAYTAESYGMGKGFYAKTGTAELDEKNVQRWLVASDDDYTAVISVYNCGGKDRLVADAKTLLSLTHEVNNKK